MRPAFVFLHQSPPPCVSSTSALISKIEITGRNLMNRYNSATNSPMVPNSAAQSHIVGLYIPHEDGRKSRCVEVMTIITRSVHMPRLITRDSRKSSGTFVRIRRDHSAWGRTTLQMINPQYRKA